MEQVLFGFAFALAQTFHGGPMIESDSFGGIGAQFRAEVGLHGDPARTVVTAAQGAAPVSQRGEAAVEVFLPGYMGGHDVVHLGHGFGVQRRQAVGQLGVLLGEGGFHHAGVFFRDQVTPFQTGVQQVFQIAAQQFVVPVVHLAGTHDAEGLGIHLAGGLAAHVLHVAEHFPFGCDHSIYKGLVFHSVSLAGKGREHRGRPAIFGKKVFPAWPGDMKKGRPAGEGYYLAL